MPLQAEVRCRLVVVERGGRWETVTMELETTSKRGRRTRDWIDWTERKDPASSVVRGLRLALQMAQGGFFSAGIVSSWAHRSRLLEGFAPARGGSSSPSSVSPRRSPRWKTPGTVQVEKGLHMRRRPDLRSSSPAHTYPEPASHRCASPRLPGPRDPATIGPAVRWALQDRRRGKASDWADVAIRSLNS